MPSCIASSFSQGDAFISSKPERTIDLHVLAAEAARGAAAVHRGVAAAEHDHALADLVDVAEGDAGEPVDADVDVGGGFLAAGHVEVAAARRAGADEDRVVALGQQRLQAVDALAEADLDADVEDVADLLVDHRSRAGGSAGSGVRIMPPALRVADRTPRRRSRAARGRAPRSARPGRRRSARCACRSSARPACGRRSRMSSLLSAATRFRRQIATGSSSTRPRRQAGSHGRSQVRPRMPGKHVRLPVDHVGVAVAAGGDQPDVFGNRRVGRAGPLAVDDLVEVVGRRCRSVSFTPRARAPVAPLREARASRRRPVLPGPADWCLNPVGNLSGLAPGIPPLATS